MSEQETGFSFQSSQWNFEIPNLQLFEQINAVLIGSPPVYLVGGAVRDLLLRRPTHDLDFVTSGDALSMARKAANALGGAYYTMDQERETGRVILVGKDDDRTVIDFARQRGERLEDDLRLRDFTINALAFDIRNPNKIIDPLGGGIDLRQKRLKACSQDSFSNDPIRVLRALRQAHAFGLKIETETLRWLRQAAPLLPRVSMERQRDEIFRILDGKSPASVLRALDMVGVLELVLPELQELKGVGQSHPHIYDVWNHSLEVLNKLEAVLSVLQTDYDPDQVNSLPLGLMVLRLGRYRTQLHEHLSRLFTPDRSGRQLLFLAALYHDIAKPQSRTNESSGRVRFFGHDRQGAEIMAQRSRALRLSNDETEHLSLTVRHHMRPFLLTQTGEKPSRKAIYRFFRDTKQAGVDVCILSVADHLGTVGPALNQDDFKAHLDTVRELLEAWWEKPHEAVTPPALIDGQDLIQEFNLHPGKKIGEILEAVREIQAAGQVHTRQEALDFVQKKLSQED